MPHFFLFINCYSLSEKKTLKRRNHLIFKDNFFFLLMISDLKTALLGKWVRKGELFLLYGKYFNYV